MAYVYNTSAKTVQVTATSTARALHDDIQTTFSGSTYMQYLIPDAGSIKDALYIFQNGWLFDSTTSVGYMTTGGWQTSDGNNKWTNVQTISGNSFTGIQLYYAQGGSPTNFGSTGLQNALIKVRNAGSDINSQGYIVYSRPFQMTYSQFSVTASAGGVDVVPLSVAADLNLTIGSSTLSGWTDVTAAWASIYRSAFDGASTTKYTLNGAHSNSVTTITCNEAIDSSVPSSGTIAIGNNVTQEIITYTGKGTYTFTGCTRGTNRTTAASYSSGQAVSTNTQSYSVVVSTTNSGHSLNDMYNWIQYKLGLNSDMDVLSGGHIGQTNPLLVSMAGSTMTTNAGVWVENFASANANNIIYTDGSANTHTPPISVAITVNFDSSIAGGQVAVFALNTTGLNDSTYTPSNISSTLINTAASGTSASTSLTYSSNIPVRVIVRKPGYQQFSLYTTVTSSGLTVTAQNPVDSTA